MTTLDRLKATSTFEGLRILAAYLAGAGAAIAIGVLFFGEPLSLSKSGIGGLMALSTGAFVASGVLARTKGPREPVLFRIATLAVLGVAFVCAVHATVGWRFGARGALAFAAFNAVLMPLAHSLGERRRMLPEAVLERPTVRQP